MNLLTRILKFLQSEAHAFLSKYEDPVKLIEQGIRDLKKDFDTSMKSIAEVKAIYIGAKKELEVKKQIATDYETKAFALLKKAQEGELDEQEADRLAKEALKKRKEALNEIKKLNSEIKKYDASLEEMSKKILELKNKIKESENAYNTLKAREIDAKTTKKVNQQLSKTNTDSTMAMIENMKTKIQAEENLAEAYGEINTENSSIDEEINKAIL